jgi:4-hydroxybenzoate polyprenyltransferase
LKSPRRTWDYLELARPFTLLAPALGMVSGGVMGWGAAASLSSQPFPLVPIAMGALMAALLNAASNALNQICDLEIDAINKPRRPLPSGRLGRSQAAWFSAILYACALVVGWLINIQCFILALIAVLFTIAYSVPPVRTKRYGLFANLTIAVPRGSLLVVAGWSTAANAIDPQPWYVSLVFGGFLLGAASTKDFSDVAGDRAGACRTLPVSYGPRAAALMMSPFLVLPFLLLPIGVKYGLLSGRPTVLTALGWLLACWGAYVAYIMVRNPDQLASENHVSWTHMYLMMACAQLGLILAYVPW